MQFLPFIVAVTVQCPNGAPPPCAPARAARPANVALDDRTWLILPFENTARNADAELIRQAGLNLLYQELSRWEDVRVISDDRVDDLLRELPEAQRSPIGLETARALARRVGAGRVVLGDYLAVGTRAQIAAKVYNAGDGRQLRLVRDRLQGIGGADALDSMSAAFSRLGAAIIGVPPRQDGQTLAGTSSFEAYRAYMEGMAVTNRLDLVEARQLYHRAIAADSGFALAHLRLALIADGDPETRVALAAAERFSGRLPPVERARLQLLQLWDRAPLRQLCEPAARLLALDSSIAEGWMGRARCERRLGDFRSMPGDPSRMLTGGSLHQARIAARRAIELDSSSVWTYLELANTMTSTRLNPVCAPRTTTGTPCPTDSLIVGALVASGDSVLLPVEWWRTARGDPPWLRPEAVQQRRRNAQERRSTMEAWIRQSPGNMGARILLGFALFDLGEAAAAAAHLDSIPTYLGTIEFVSHVGRARISLALERPDVRLRVDSVYISPESSAVDGQLWAMIGRYRRDPEHVPLAQRAIRERWLPIFAGILPANFDSIEAAYRPLLTAIQQRTFPEISSLVAFRMRGTAPVADTAAVHPIRRFQSFMSLRDTTAARAALATFDSVLARRVSGTPDDAGWLFAAEGHLALGDTARALATMQVWAGGWRTRDHQTAERILDANLYTAVPRLYGRMWLLLGDLAVRTDPVAARRAYRMVINLWQDGDAPVQPLVTRARAALAQLGN